MGGNLEATSLSILSAREYYELPFLEVTTTQLQSKPKNVKQYVFYIATYTLHHTALPCHSHAFVIMLTHFSQFAHCAFA